jgi:hypothetical protein
MYRSRLRDSSTIRRSGTEPVESCSWCTATASGTYSVERPDSRRRLQKSTSSE